MIDLIALIGIALALIGLVLPTLWPQMHRGTARGIFIFGVILLIVAGLVAFFPTHKTAIKQISSRYQWVRLSEKEINDMALAFRARGAHTVRILVCPTLDCDELGDDFSKIFEKAEWHIKPKEHLSTDYKGIHISITRNTINASYQVMEVLRQQKYEVALWGDPNAEGISEVWLLIGMKGYPQLPHP